ncbi:DNA-3-methyladenine glycosylase [Nocardioides panacihumi]|uniref:DNA-3-methyladenine glycosylase n=1 Tax=Nocardioides panacihumi TaxID=400774 RepID=UPI0031CF1EE1
MPAPTSTVVTELAELLSGPPEQVAPLLLGGLLSHGGVTVRLTEVEAYAGPADPGSHAYRGRTDRNAVMFGPAGHLYVYFTYGMHFCANVVCGPEGEPSGCLLRAGEVVAGIDLARERRPRSGDRDLARGPARLTRALDLTREHDGADLTRGPVRLELGEPVDRVSTGPRVGLRGAPERPWRFWVTDDPTVSVYRPAKALPSGRRAGP